MASSKIFNFLSLLVAFVLLFSSQVAARELATTYPALGRPSIGRGGCISNPNKPCSPVYSPPKRGCLYLKKCRPPTN